MNHQNLQLRLDFVAAKSALLAAENRQGKLHYDEIQRAILELIEELRRAEVEATR